ncbi:hypothetical protein MAR_004257, partial [Mya arenaria]
GLNNPLRCKLHNTVNSEHSACFVIRILVTCTGAAVNATVCGQTQINSNTKICCGSLPHARFIGGSELGCFQDTPYILKAEECCENKVINRSKELCCKNNIVTKMHPSHYRCCNINHAWTTYNEFDPPKECLLKHIRKTLHNNPTKTGRRSGGNQIAESVTTERSPLEECPFTKSFDREQKQRSTCKKF